MSLWRNKLVYLCVGVAMLIQPLQQSFSAEISVEIKSDVGLFYEQLSPYGIWVTTKSGVLTWVPTQTPTDWRPYTMGQWSYTPELGWFWNSSWPWGWATFHYGRWMFDSDYGWAWVPGSQWAPAWVAWRVGNGLIGWAPLSPEIELGGGEQQLSDQTLNNNIDIYSWSFVPEKEILSTNLHAKAIIMSALNVTMTRNTSSASRYQIDENGVINYGVDPQTLLRDANINVRGVEMVDVTFPEAIEATHLKENQVAVFRPKISMTSKTSAPTNSDGVENLSKEALLKQHKNLKNTLDMYHMLEVKAMAHMHTQQSAESGAAYQAAVVAQQKSEQESLQRLHTREQDVLKKRFERELGRAGKR